MWISALGTIEEIGSGLSWDRDVLAREVQRRAGTLAAAGFDRKARVAIAHGGTAAFFADLLAVWTLGATAAVIDPKLTPSELKILLQYFNPDAVLVARSGAATEGGWSVMALDDPEPSVVRPAAEQAPDDPGIGAGAVHLRDHRRPQRRRVELRFMGAGFSVGSAFIVESLTKVINLVGALNPGNVGTYEGGSMLIAKMFGVTSTTGLTLALCRRARTVFWAGVGAMCMIVMKKAEAPSKIAPNLDPAVELSHGE